MSAIPKVHRESFLGKPWQVAVVYAPGHGARWSTQSFSDPNLPALLVFHEAIVRYVLDTPPAQRTERDLEVVLDGIMGHDSEPSEFVYCGAVLDLAVRWLDVGTRFRILAHEGNEWVETYDPSDYPHKA